MWLIIIERSPRPPLFAPRPWPWPLLSLLFSFYFFRQFWFFKLQFVGCINDCQFFMFVLLYNFFKVLLMTYLFVFVPCLPTFLRVDFFLHATFFPVFLKLWNIKNVYCILKIGSPGVTTVYFQSVSLFMIA